MGFDRIILAEYKMTTFKKTLLDHLRAYGILFSDEGDTIRTPYAVAMRLNNARREMWAVDSPFYDRNYHSLGVSSFRVADVAHALTECQIEFAARVDRMQFRAFTGKIGDALPHWHYASSSCAALSYHRINSPAVAENFACGRDVVGTVCPRFNPTPGMLQIRSRGYHIVMSTPFGADVGRVEIMVRRIVRSYDVPSVWTFGVAAGETPHGVLIDYLCETQPNDDLTYLQKLINGQEVIR